MQEPYRRLLRAYPRAYRRRHGDEIVTTLLESTPSRADLAHLVLCGLRQRFRLPLRPLPIVAALLAAVAFAGLGAVAGTWLGWQTAADTPSSAEMSALSSGEPAVYETRTAMGGPSVMSVANLSGAPGGVQERLDAGGWRLTDYRTRSAGILVGTETLPTEVVMFRAAKDGLSLNGVTTTWAKGTDVHLDVWADPTPFIRPIAIGGLAVGAFVGWLVAAAIAYRVRLTGRPRPGLAAAQAATVFAGLSVPVFLLYRAFYLTMTYDIGNPNAYIAAEPENVVPAGLVPAGLGLAALALATLAVVLLRAGKLPSGDRHGATSSYI